MSSAPRPGPDPRGGPPAFTAFLLSLLVPGTGQMAAGAWRRGCVWLTLAAVVLTPLGVGWVPRVGRAGTDARSLAWLGASALIWVLVPYDAWFLVRERRHAMLPHLPRTPRVAFLAGILCGGAGQVYLGLGRGLALLPVTAGVGVGLLIANAWPWLVALGVWNMVWAIRAHRLATRRHHDTPAYRSCAAALAAAPFASPQAPSPSLPLVTLVAAAILVGGGTLIHQTLADLAGQTVSVAGPSGRIEGNRFRDPRAGIEMTLPGDGWRFTPGRTPVLLTGRHPARALAFSLAAAGAPLTGSTGAAPAAALARFAARQQIQLADRLDGFELLSRNPVSGPMPGVQLVFRSSEAGVTKLTVQEYLVAHDRILVLTLVAPDTQPVASLESALEGLVADLSVNGEHTP